VSQLEAGNLCNPKQEGRTCRTRDAACNAADPSTSLRCGGGREELALITSRTDCSAGASSIIARRKIGSSREASSRANRAASLLLSRNNSRAMASPPATVAFIYKAVKRKKSSCSR
jgi:hypothetical protein